MRMMNNGLKNHKTMRSMMKAKTLTKTLATTVKKNNPGRTMKRSTAHPKWPPLMTPPLPPTRMPVVASKNSRQLEVTFPSSP